MINKIIEILKKKNVLFAYLFGSYVSVPKQVNDIDIAVYFKKNKTKI